MAFEALREITVAEYLTLESNVLNPDKPRKNQAIQNRDSSNLLNKILVNHQI